MKYILIAFILLLNSCSKPSLKNPQDALAYLDPATANQSILSPLQAKLAYTNMLNNYYYPWNNKTLDLNKTKSLLREQIKNFTDKPGWNENQQPHAIKWINNIVNNMDLENFPNHIQTAIIIHDTNARIFPTQIPSYTDIHNPGEFYPFDNFQDSYIAAGTPVKIIHESRDKSWDFVLIENSIFGDWIPAEDVAYVDDSFIKNWQNNLGYIAIRSDDIPLLNLHHHYYYKTRMGEIYPINKISTNYLTLKIAVKNTDNNAVIQESEINKNTAYILPLITTPKNIAIIANQFINQPYGWGGLYGYRDCSSTTKNIFAYFGIWLPHASELQKEQGGLDINLANLSDAQKQKIILEKAVPYFSLLYVPGHIVLYLGEKNNILYVFQDMWGLKTYRLFKPQGRIVIGKTVITPITFGKECWNVPKTLLTKITDLIILNGERT